MPKQARPRNVYLRAAQHDMLASEAGRLRRWCCCWLSAACGEVIALRVCDVDFLRRRVEGAPQRGAREVHRRQPQLEREPHPRWLSGHDRVSRDRHRQMPRAPAVDPHSTAATSVPGWPFTHCGIQRPRGLSRRARASKVVQRMLGHASAAITLDVYADLFECDLDAVAESVSKMCRLGGSEGTPA